MNNKIMLDYLSALAENNNREWYHAHKNENKEATLQFERLIQELICGVGAFDESVLHNVPKELTFKCPRVERRIGFRPLRRRCRQTETPLNFVWKANNKLNFSTKNLHLCVKICRNEGD